MKRERPQMAATCPTSVSSDGQLTSPSPTFAPQRPLCDVKRTHARANAMPGRGPYEPAAFFSANDGGSLHSGPLQMGCLGNWGLPVRLARIQQWCRACTTCTDRSSSKHWLERLSRPDLGSWCIRPYDSHQAIRLAGRLCPSCKPSGSVGGVVRLVKAEHLRWPSATLDQPPDTACLISAACPAEDPSGSPLSIAVIKNGLSNESS